MDQRKQAIMNALDGFVRQRAGLEPGNYSDVQSYRSEQRSVTKDLHDYRKLERAVTWRDSISADMLIYASRNAFSGRLTLIEERRPVQNAAYYGLAESENECRVFKIGYCTGQYFPTEYRKAACAVLASALWAYARENMPAPNGKLTVTSTWGESEHDNINGMTPGDWLRGYFVREFGRGLARAYFS